jgi:hypothetical protein
MAAKRRRNRSECSACVSSRSRNDARKLGIDDATTSRMSRSTICAGRDDLVCSRVGLVSPATTSATPNPAVRRKSLTREWALRRSLAPLSKPMMNPSYTSSDVGSVTKAQAERQAISPRANAKDIDKDGLLPSLM